MARCVTPPSCTRRCLEGLVLFVVLWIFTRKPRPRLAPSGLFLLLYGMARFGIEFVRVPDANLGYLVAGWVTMGQILSLPMILGGIILLAIAYRRRAPSGNFLRRDLKVQGAVRQYLELMRQIREHGVAKEDRTGTGTLSLFGQQLRFDLGAGFPLVTTKKVHLRSVVYELLWFLRGDTNVAWLREHGVSIWDEWADAEGELGPVYGRQWRAWPAAGWPHHRPDQHGAAAVAAYPGFPAHDRQRLERGRAGAHEAAALPCDVPVLCGRTARLSCHLYQRSADFFLGVPFNIASYALLTHMMAQQSDLEPGELVWTGGDCHLYLNHLAQADEQLARAPLPLPQTADQAPAARPFQL